MKNKISKLSTQIKVKTEYNNKIEFKILKKKWYINLYHLY